MNTQKSIVVLGASSNPNRTSYLAAKILMQKGYQVNAYGNTEGKIDAIPIELGLPKKLPKEIDVISIFLKPNRQKAFYNFILDTKPKSIIFNPGSENEELEKLAQKRDIKIVSCCTIALSAVGML